MALGFRRSHFRSLRLSPARAAGLLALATALIAPVEQPAHAQPPPAAPAVQPIPDPWEKHNRSAFASAVKADQAVIEPVVHGYIRATPAPLRAAIGRAIHNLDEPRIAGNDILQGHPKRAGSAIGRFLLNSVAGVGGLFDPATAAGLERHESDFGQTLGRYGAGTGPYIMLPFVGPSDVRDGVGFIVDSLADPLNWATGGLAAPFAEAHYGVSMAQARVDSDDLMTGAPRQFTDPYAALRSAYSQNRASQVREAKGQPAASAVQALPDVDPPPTVTASPPPSASPLPEPPSMGAPRP